MITDGAPTRSVRETDETGIAPSPRSRSAQFGSHRPLLLLGHVNTSAPTEEQTQEHAKVSRLGEERRHDRADRTPGSLRGNLPVPSGLLPGDFVLRTISVRATMSFGGARVVHDAGVVTGSADRAEMEFSAFFREHFAAVLRTTYLIVHDQELARDVTQDAFVSLFSRWHRISRYERPDGWVRRVAIRSAVRAVRRERARPHVEREMETGRMPGPVDLDVVRAVRGLPAMQRAAVVLFYFEDRSIAQVAATLGCSEVAAKVHLHRARRSLAEALRDPGSSEERRDVI